MATLKWWDDLGLTEEEGKWLDVYLDWHAGRITFEQLKNIERDIFFNIKFKSEVNAE